ncbi:RNA polymerase sigma factor [Winogradskyella jejuensis]|uniref:RNA polymerase sigma-70 factor, ECF subfamily n=1 Tax=Winogradskyella jejuensis TaxID=1089305 RepID=A0A1M5MXK5_9FLAO|nr:RNA polymerase sigma factor [Winogradskyella jejuensis]SHG82011.1 RNA polymerase sigma-70 factor, ECF subfamily [Winogradskyella jejuensis]
MNIEKDFTQIYNTHAPKVLRLCLGYASGDGDLAKEWLQETFIKVWNHRKSFNQKSSIGTWIYRIAVNVCLSDLRKPKKTIQVDDTVISQDIQEDFNEDETDKITKLYLCIDKLTEQNKGLILLELEEIPQATIAETLGLAHNAVRTRLSRIRKALLKCMTNGK